VNFSLKTKFFIQYIYSIVGHGIGTYEFFLQVVLIDILE